MMKVCLFVNLFLSVQDIDVSTSTPPKKKRKADQPPPDQNSPKKQKSAQSDRNETSQRNKRPQQRLPHPLRSNKKLKKQPSVDSEDMSEEYSIDDQFIDFGSSDDELMPPSEDSAEDQVEQEPTSKRKEIWLDDAEDHNYKERMKHIKEESPDGNHDSFEVWFIP
jgi:hypothetical protein